MVLVLNLAIATLLTVGGLGRLQGQPGGVDVHRPGVLADHRRRPPCRGRAARPLARRARPAARPALRLSGLALAAGAVLLGLVLGPILGNLLAAQISGDHIPGLWPFAGSGNGITWLLTLLASGIAVLTLTLLERLSHARADAEAARRAAAENQLKLLESQLEPHMLFNTLANLRVLIAMDPPRAQAMLDRLIAFLRATLSASRSSHAPAGHRVRAHRRLPGADGRAHGRPAADAAVAARGAARGRRAAAAAAAAGGKQHQARPGAQGGRRPHRGQCPARWRHAGAERARQRRRPGRHGATPATAASGCSRCANGCRRCTAAAPAWSCRMPPAAAHWRASACP